MTMRTPKGQSISRIFFAEKERLEWIGKIYNNARRLLNRVADVATIGPSSFNPKRNNICLYFDGSAAALARIEKVFKVSFVNNEARVKFSRITVKVVLIAQNAKRIAA